MNRQSNTYTIIYSIILVAVVGVVLSIVYQALRPKQLENIADDTKRQILAAALITPASGESVSEVYASHITDSFIVNSAGERTDASADPFDINVALEVKKPADERQLPVFVCNTEAGTKYIVPVYGAGLWGPIWGYVAMDSYGDTIYGAYFAHQGETPGLGAEIEKPAFSNQFNNLHLFKEGRFLPIAVVKAGQAPLNGEDKVDAISGGTITSKGVASMIDNCLGGYTKFLQSLNNNQQ